MISKSDLMRRVSSCICKCQSFSFFFTSLFFTNN